MSAPYSNIPSKASTALQSLITAIGATNLGDANVYVSIGTVDDVLLPKIECKAEQTNQQEPPFSGNFWAAMKATVISTSDPDPNLGETAADKLTQHNSRAGYVFDAIMSDSLAADLTAVAPDDFTCQAVQNPLFGDPFAQDNTIRTEISFEALCCASDL